MKKETYTIRTRSRRSLDYANPKPNQFKFSDIVAGLETEYRFSGQTVTKYSVLQHSIGCANRAVRLRLPDSICAAVLMHDAAEAFCKDIPRPLKLLLGSAYTEIEDRVQRCIGVKFGIDFDAHAEIVKEIDNFILKKEKQVLWQTSIRGPINDYVLVNSASYFCKQNFTELAIRFRIDTTK